MRQVVALEALTPREPRLSRQMRPLAARRLAVSPAWSRMEMTARSWRRLGLSN